jgi:hypothetical protein
MKKLLCAVVLGVALGATNAQAQTATPAATPVAAATAANIMGKRIETSSAYMDRRFMGTCTVNPPSIAAAGSVLISCSVPGVATNDLCFTNLQLTADADACLLVPQCSASADTITMRFVNNITASTACDAGNVTVMYDVIRANPHF